MPSLDIWKVRFRDVQRIATVNILTVDQELVPCVLPLCLVPFWVIHVAAGRFEFTAHTYQGVSQCFHLAALWLWANFFFSLYTSFSLSVKRGQYAHFSRAKICTVCLILTFLKISYVSWCMGSHSCSWHRCPLFAHKIMVHRTVVASQMNHSSIFFIGSREDYAKSLTCLAHSEHPVSVDAIEWQG